MKDGWMSTYLTNGGSITGRFKIAEITNTTVSKNDKFFDFLRLWNQTSVEEY